MKTKTITRAAMALTLIFICFSIFKGTTNILNALFIPLILYFGLFQLSSREFIAVTIATILFCFIFFKVQIIFVLAYCSIALLLIWLNNKSYGWLLAAALLTVAISVSFFIALTMTDFIFGTQINTLLIRMLGGNIIAYCLLLLCEGLLISLIQISAIWKFGSRMMV